MGSNPIMMEMNDALPGKPEPNFSADISRQIWCFADSCFNDTFIGPSNAIKTSEKCFFRSIQVCDATKVASPFSTLSLFFLKRAC